MAKLIRYFAYSCVMSVLASLMLEAFLKLVVLL
jgi:hypothetical protein